MKFLSLTSRNMKKIYRDPVVIVLGVALPSLLLFLFTSIGKSASVDIFTPKMLTPAVIVFSYGFLTMFSATLLAKDRQTAFLTRLFIAPLKSTDFILSYLLAFIPLALFQSAVCFFIGSLLSMVAIWTFFPTLFTLIPMAIVCIGIGMILGSLCTENQVAVGGSILIVLISLFGGTWMDLKMVGGIFKTLGYALPFAYAIDAAREILRGLSIDKILTELYWVLGYMVISIFVGIIAFKWRMKQ